MTDAQHGEGMMHYAVVDSGGRIQLGEQARRLGFHAGAVVQVIVTRAGSLILTVGDAPTVDASFKPLAGSPSLLAERSQP
jgi:hypothetical protein